MLICSRCQIAEVRKCENRRNAKIIRYHNGWGLSDGEGLERDWSFLDPLIAILRTSTRLHRLQAIELRSTALALLLLPGTGDWLLGQFKKSTLTVQEAQDQLKQLCKEPNPYQTGWKNTSTYFQKQWEAKREANCSTAKDIKVRQQIELGKLLCLEQKMYPTCMVSVLSSYLNFKY